MRARQPVGGNDICQARGCCERGVGCNDDGDFLCEDCLFEWTVEQTMPKIVSGSTEDDR